MSSQKQKALKKSLTVGFATFVIFGLILVTPAKYIPYKKIQLYTENLELSAIDRMGVMPTLMIVGVLVAIMFVWSYVYYKNPKNKDER